VSRYRCVDAQKAAGFPVVAACQAAGVSASAFYAWAAKGEQGQRAVEQAQAELVAKIRTIHAESAGTYGSPRVTHELRRRGWRVNHQRVERLMAVHGIVGHRPRRRRGLTKADTATPPAPDLVGRLFDPDQPDRIWVSDLTYVPTDEGWLYLASVLDLASRHLLGWSMAPTTMPAWSVMRSRLRWPPAAGHRWRPRSSTPTVSMWLPVLLGFLTRTAMDARGCTVPGRSQAS
jgi:transposase InsO family protein